ncbi:MAG: DUF4124 domain-containing protein [Thermomonas sp.]|uniref:DUF4124 domain-containing protein n=1 Tax=Thermomonas sp. TaxID=1971895 RepID=UPI0039E2E8E1
MNTIRPLAAGLVLALVAMPALAQQQRVYQWKDAKGVTHYTDQPPSQAHQTRDIAYRDGTPAPAAKASPESTQCKDARSNVQRLQSDQGVSIDNDGDGKPDRTLDANERKTQLELNQAAVKAYCPAT